MSQYYVLNPDHTVTRVADFAEMAAQSIVDRRVAKDSVGDAEVSTVFLSFDHNWRGGEPILFESMIFGGEFDEYCDRYHTWDQAVAGHDRIVERLRAGQDPGGES